MAWLAGSELLILTWLPPPSSVATGSAAASAPLVARLLLIPGFGAPPDVLYPMTHWLAMMLLGWAFGRRLLGRTSNVSERLDTEKLLLLSGLSALLLSLFLRRANGYGTMGLLRDDASLGQWLHMSKYPPALVFSLFELGLMALVLVAFLAYERRVQVPARAYNPLLVFGQTALFFYVLHFLVLGGSAFAITGGLAQRGLEETYLAAAGTLIVLYPVCLAYRRLKRRHPTSFLQYI